MEQFGPALQWPWSKLTDVPELSGALLDRIAEQSDAQADGLSARELGKRRDSGQGWGAGAVLVEHEHRLLEAAASRHAGDAVDTSRPLALVRTQVPPEWVD